MRATGKRIFRVRPRRIHVHQRPRSPHRKSSEHGDTEERNRETQREKGEGEREREKPGVRLTPIDRPGEDRGPGERTEGGGYAMVAAALVLMVVVVQGTKEKNRERESEQEAQKRFSRSGVVFGARGWSDRWKLLRDEGGGCQGNALSASAYFSSARALGSIQHHPWSSRPKHTPSTPLPPPPPPLLLPPSTPPPPVTPFLRLSACLFVLLSGALARGSSPPRRILLFPSCLVSRLPSGSFPLCSAVFALLSSLSSLLCSSPVPVSRSLFRSRSLPRHPVLSLRLALSLLFAECTRASPFGGCDSPFLAPS